MFEDLFAPVPRPAWPRPRRLSARACRKAFDATTPFTIGLEEELMFLSPETLDLEPAVERVLSLLGDARLFHRELRAAQIEIVTPVCTKVAEAAVVLTDARRRLVSATSGDVLVAGAGTHPFAAGAFEVTEHDRYALIASEYPWGALRGVAFGLHVHVAVGGADRSLAVYNALRSYLPEVAALAANSPFLEGKDSGLASARSKLNEAFPRAGVPPPIPSWEHFVGLLDWARTGGVFPDASYLWWELRPHPSSGTIELRTPDTQTRVEDAAAVAAFVQALVAWLAARYDAGDALRVHDSFHIGENVWSAVRHGLRGWMVDLETGKAEPTRDRLGALLDTLEPVAHHVGCDGELAGARVLLAGNGADRQRYVAMREGVDGLVRRLVAETEPPDEAAETASTLPASRPDSRASESS